MSTTDELRTPRASAACIGRGCSRTPDSRDPPVVRYETPAAQLRAADETPAGPCLLLGASAWTERRRGADAARHERDRSETDVSAPRRAQAWPLRAQRGKWCGAFEPGVVDSFAVLLSR